MNQQDSTGYFHSTSERAHFRIGQAQSSSSSDMAIQMLLNKKQKKSRKQTNR